MFTTTASKNATSAAYKDKHEQLDFLLALTVDSLILFCTLWLVFALLTYGLKTNRFRRRSSSDFNGGIVYTFAFLSAAFLVIRLIASILLFTVPTYKPAESDITCGILYDVTVILYVLALIPVYLLLWLRQRVLYSHPTMSKMHNSLLVVLSWSSICLLIGAAIGLAVLFTYEDNFTSGYNGCVVKDTGSILPNVLTAIVLVSGQVMLLWLFVAPLRKQAGVSGQTRQTRPTLSQKIMANMRWVANSTWSRGESSSAAENQQPKPDDVKEGEVDAKPQEADRLQRTSAPNNTLNRRLQKKTRSVNRIRHILRRSIVFGGICMSSDLITLGLLSFVVGNKYPKNVPFMIYDVSLFVNVISVIFSFDNYKAMVLSPCIDLSKVKRSVTEISSRQNSAASET